MASTGQTVGAGAASGAASGAAMGSMMGPGYGTLVGGIIGGIGGAIGGMGQASAAKAQAEALQAQREAIRAEQIAKAKGIGAAREKFGDVSQWGQKFTSVGDQYTRAHDPSKFQDIGKTLANRSAIAGGVEQQVGAMRDASRQGITNATQQGAAGMRASLAGRGLFGSSLDVSAKQNLLAQYGGARSQLAGAAEGVRQSSYGAVKATQNAFEGAAQSGGNIQNQLNALSTASSIASARGQQGAAFGANLINAGMGVANYGALAQANGGVGVQAFGLPKMNLPGNKVAGATTSKGY